MDVRNRARGALLGAVVGDALGRPFEGTARGDLDRLRIALARRLAKPQGWDYSDDAEMMLGVAASIAEFGDVHPAVLLDTLERGHDPARGYGKGMLAAFRAWRTSHSTTAASTALWPDGSRGNGGAARVAPVAIRLHQATSIEVAAAARRSAEPTHAHDEAKDGAALIAVGVHHALGAGDPRSVFTALESVAVGSDFRSALEAAMTIRDEDEAIDTLGHGVLALQSVPLALWTYARATSFEGAVRSAVELGGDTDTIATMVGGRARARDNPCGRPRAVTLGSGVAQGAGEPRLACRSLMSEP